jgi:hypothetical protein
MSGRRVPQPIPNSLVRNSTCSSVSTACLQWQRDLLCNRGPSSIPGPGIRDHHWPADVYAGNLQMEVFALSAEATLASKL